MKNTDCSIKDYYADQLIDLENLKNGVCLLRRWVVILAFIAAIPYGVAAGVLLLW